MRHEPRAPETLAPLYDAMMHVARLMADAAEAADWETVGAARDCAKFLTARIDEASAEITMPPEWSKRRYAVLRDVLAQDARVRDAMQPISPRLALVLESTPARHDTPRGRR